MQAIHLYLKRIFDTREDIQVYLVTKAACKIVLLVPTMLNKQTNKNTEGKKRPGWIDTKRLSDYL